MITVYITRAKTNSFQTTEVQMANIQEGIRRRAVRVDDTDIYDYRPRETYKKMFSQPSIWMNYQEFNPEDRTDKIYI